LVLAASCIVAIAPAAAAQSGQTWSLQASVLAASQNIGDEAVNGVGFEGQLRYTPPKVYSFGVGFQYSTHTSGEDKITIMGAFLEPRYVVDIGSDRIAPYIAGRLAFLRQSLTLSEQSGLEFKSSGTAIGGGAGMLIRLTPKINIDIGAAFVNQGFGDASDGGINVSFERFNGYVAKAGFSFGFGSQ
jgi:opacity protein-like surface antigen